MAPSGVDRAEAVTEVEKVTNSQDFRNHSRADEVKGIRSQPLSFLLSHLTRGPVNVVQPVSMAFQDSRRRSRSRKKQNKNSFRRICGGQIQVSQLVRPILRGEMTKETRLLRQGAIQE